MLTTLQFSVLHRIVDIRKYDMFLYNFTLIYNMVKVYAL